MYLRDLGVSLLRRWYLLIPAVLLAVSAGYGTAHVVGPTYSTRSGVVLLPPTDPKNPDANRFLALGSLKQAADVLVRSLSNDATAHSIREQVSGGEYGVAPDYTTSAPVVVVTATAPNPATAGALLDAVMKRVPVNLQNLQDGLGIETKNQIVTEVVNTAGTPTLVLKKQLRMAVAAAILVFGLLAVLIGAFDGIVMRRRLKRSAIHAVRSPDIAAGPESRRSAVTADHRSSTERPKARRTQ